MNKNYIIALFTLFSSLNTWASEAELYLIAARTLYVKLLAVSASDTYNRVHSNINKNEKTTLAGLCTYLQEMHNATKELLVAEELYKDLSKHPDHKKKLQNNNLLKELDTCYKATKLAYAKQSLYIIVKIILLTQAEENATQAAQQMNDTCQQQLINTATSVLLSDHIKNPGGDASYVLTSLDLLKTAHNELLLNTPHSLTNAEASLAELSVILNEIAKMPNPTSYKSPFLDKMKIQSQQLADEIKKARASLPSRSVAPVKGHRSLEALD